VGALRALAEIAPPGPLPFDILAGISAGAINSVALATAAENFQEGARRLSATWDGLTPDRIFRTGTLKLASIGSRWLADLSAGGLVGKSGINYLLDPSPLRELISSVLPLGRMRHHFRTGKLRAVAVSATNYHTGAGVTFFEGASDIQSWVRSSRLGFRERITIDHVMASAAVPVFFPPVQIDGTFYGDGCVRMAYPMSPAIHLGAERILAVSVRHLRSATETAQREVREKADQMPLSEIAGVLLNAVFLDSVDSDFERLDRVNRTLALVPRDRLEKVEMRAIPALVLRPSEDLGKLAADEYVRFPRMLRYLLKGIGAAGHSGEDLLSYLAFEPTYVRRVMELGYEDTMVRRDEVAEFLGAGAPPRRQQARGA
jgi:NTE family protein